MAFLNSEKPTTSPRAKVHKITLAVRHSGTKRSDELLFLIKSTDPMWKLMDAVCGRWGSSKEKARFFADGVRVNPDDTPQLVSRVPYLLRAIVLCISPFG